MFMSQRRTLLALCAVALCAVLLLPDVSSAQFFGRGGRGFGAGIGNYGGYGWGGNYGGWGNYGGYGLGNYGGYGWGQPYYGGMGYGWSSPGYFSSPSYGGNYGGMYVSPGYYSNPQPYNYSSPIVSGNYGGMAISSQSAYPPSGQQGMMMDQNRAFIDVHVPPNAQVMFDNSPTQQQGPERRFMTPPLEPNSHYTYNVTAKWTDQNGQEKRESRTVRLTPGQTTHVNFTAQDNTDGVRRPDGVRPDGTRPDGTRPDGTRPQNPNQQPPRPGQTTPPPTTPPDR